LINFKEELITLVNLAEDLFADHLTIIISIGFIKKFILYNFVEHFLDQPKCMDIKFVEFLRKEI